MKDHSRKYDESIHNIAYSAASRYLVTCNQQSTFDLIPWNSLAHSPLLPHSRRRWRGERLLVVRVMRSTIVYWWSVYLNERPSFKLMRIKLCQWWIFVGKMRGKKCLPAFYLFVKLRCGLWTSLEEGMGRLLAR